MNGFSWQGTKFLSSYRTFFIFCSIRKRKQNGFKIKFGKDMCFLVFILKIEIMTKFLYYYENYGQTTV